MKLIEINLKKGQGHHHPDIKTDGTNYLVEFKNDKHFHCGSFKEVWYGLNFDGWKWNLSAGLQFDTPGQNSSKWKRVWEIVKE